MSINVTTETKLLKTEIANVEMRLRRHCDFQNGAPVITYPVEITYGKTEWIVDASGTVTGLVSGTASEQSTFVLEGKPYMDFASYVLTEDEAKMPVGQFLPILIDRCIQAHLNEQAQA